MSPDFHFEPATVDAQEVDPSSRSAAAAPVEREKAQQPPRLVPLPPGIHATGAAGTTTSVIRLPR